MKCYNNFIRYGERRAGCPSDLISHIRWVRSPCFHHMHVTAFYDIQLACWCVEFAENGEVLETVVFADELTDRADEQLVELVLKRSFCLESEDIIVVDKSRNNI